MPVSEIRTAVLADTRAKIAEHGWTVIAVFPTPEDPGPSFAYTVGLSGEGLPEVSPGGGASASTASSVWDLDDLKSRLLESGDRLARQLCQQ